MTAAPAAVHFDLLVVPTKQRSMPRSRERCAIPSRRSCAPYCVVLYHGRHGAASTFTSSCDHMTSCRVPRLTGAAGNAGEAALSKNLFLDFCRSDAKQTPQYRPKPSAERKRGRAPCGIAMPRACTAYSIVGGSVCTDRLVALLDVGALGSSWQQARRSALAIPRIS